MVAGKKEKAVNAIKVNLLFPLSDNDGKPFSADIWNWWFLEMARLFKGFTDMGIVKGWWQGYSDVNRWVVIILESEEGLDEVRRFLIEACGKGKFDQKKMYLDYHAIHYEEVS